MHNIAGTGELHLEICLNDLKDQEIRTSRVLSWTVCAESSEMGLNKSPNKHNRLCMKVVPMPDGLAKDIDKASIIE